MSPVKHLRSSHVEDIGSKLNAASTARYTSKSKVEAIETRGNGAYKIKMHILQEMGITQVDGTL